MLTAFSFKEDVDKGAYARLKEELRVLESDRKRGVYPQTLEGHAEGCDCNYCKTFAGAQFAKLGSRVRKARFELKNQRVCNQKNYSELVHNKCTVQQKKIYEKCNRERHEMGGTMDPQIKEHHDLLVKHVAEKMGVGLPVDTPWDEEYVEEAIELFGWSTILWWTA